MPDKQKHVDPSALAGPQLKRVLSVLVADDEPDSVKYHRGDGRRARNRRRRCRTPGHARHGRHGDGNVSEDPTPLDKLIVPASGIRFGDMTGRQKSIFAVKLVCCICTMGFAFPNVMHD